MQNRHQKNNSHGQLTNKVIGYVRVSAYDQFSEGGSIQAQENSIIKFCNENKLELIQIFSEKTHVSTRIPMVNRVEGGLVAKCMDSSKYDYGLVIVKLDRAFRSTAEAITHINNWSQTKPVYILDFLNGQKFDSTDPMMKMLLSMMSAFAELERDTISKRTTAVMQDKKNNRIAYCGKVYGYDRIAETNELIENQEEQRALHEIFNLNNKGYGLRKLANYLNKQGYPTATGGKKWYASTLSYMLKNELYKPIRDKYFSANL